jgi:S1-C subfamily serine protease
METTSLWTYKKAKPPKMTALGLFLLTGVILATGCTTTSYRETPVVKVIQVYAPNVVNIRTETIIDLKELPEWGLYGEQLDLLFKQYYGEDYSEGTLRSKSLGSGVIVNGDGFIVTNAHVVQRASNISVVLLDGTELEASVMKVDPEDDLAVIKITLPGPIKPLRFADTGKVMIGETVIAIGNPFGLENSVTVGVLSGVNRAFASPQCGYVCSGLLQTDASINPGNSGGALLNLDGELVGINLAVVQNAQNIGFAVPANKIILMLNELKR